MWTRGLRTRSSLSWMLALPDMWKYLPSMPHGPNPVLLVSLPPGHARDLDAHLLEEAVARRVVGDQLGEQIRQGSPAPADHLFQGVGNDRMRLGPLEERGDVQQVAEG